jgi:hypothetical protein
MHKFHAAVQVLTAAAAAAGAAAAATTTTTTTTTKLSFLWWRTFPLFFLCLSRHFISSADPFLCLSVCMVFVIYKLEPVTFFVMCISWNPTYCGEALDCILILMWVIKRLNLHITEPCLCRNLGCRCALCYFCQMACTPYQIKGTWELRCSGILRSVYW